MQLSDQVISLEQAKKLRDLGFTKKSLYCYQYTKSINKEMNGYNSITTSYRMSIPTINPKPIEQEFLDNPDIPAYTVSELMDILPTIVLAKYDEESDILTDYMLGVFKSYYTLGDNPEKIYQYIVQYSYEEDLLDDNDINGTNLAQALGDMLIYLITNNYIKCN